MNLTLVTISGKNEKKIRKKKVYLINVGDFEVLNYSM